MLSEFTLVICTRKSYCYMFVNLLKAKTLHMGMQNYAKEKREEVEMGAEHLQLTIPTILPLNQTIFFVLLD